MSEEVYADVRKVMVCLLEVDIINKTQMLLDAISTRDWQTYESLCDETLTSFEEETKVVIDSIIL